MPDVFDQRIAELQITKEVLESLGVTKSLFSHFPNQPAQAKQLIDEYAKYYRQLWKVIHAPHEE